jgi:anti-sigma factor RsiW
MKCACEKLEAFLADDLPTDAARRFEAHLAACAACRDAVEQQRWIDGLLRSPLRHELEAAPVGVAESVREAIWRRRRLARFFVGGFAAAAAILVAAGWTMFSARQSDRSAFVVTEVVREPSPRPALEAKGNEPVPRAEFVGGPDVIVVPVETSHPNVTVVRVYPTYQPSYAVQASVDQPAVGADLASPYDLNGG